MIQINGKYRPRVVMLGPLPPLMGGMATVLSNLRESILARRCRLTVLNNGKTTPEGRSVLTGIMAQLKLVDRLAGTIRRERIQLVHIHTCSGITFWRDSLHMLTARMLGCQVVCHIHGARFDEFIESMGSLQKTFMRLALNITSVVIVLSQEWLKKLRLSSVGANWRVIPNGVATPQSTCDLQRKIPSFLFLGDLGARKGVHNLVEATGVAVKNGFNGVVNLAGGETESGQKNELKRHIGKCGCASRIHLLGVVSGQDKEHALATADCFVLPSYAEGLPMAILEAMAYGLPIIATNVGAVPEVITDGQEGFLIEPGDVKALSDRMVRLGNDANLRRRMGQAAYRRVKADYSLDATVDQLMNVYSEVIDGTSP